MKHLNRMRNERGSTSYIVIFILLGSILISFVFFDLFTTFSGKRISQTGADAVAIAAATEMKRAYEPHLAEKIDDEIEDLLDEIEEYMEEEEASWDEAMSEFYVPNELEQRLLNSSAELEIEVPVDYFDDVFDDAGLTAIICEGIYNQQSRIDEVTRYYAGQNRVEDDFSMQFPVDGEAKVIINTKHPVSFITVGDGEFSSESSRTVTSEAAANVVLPVEMEFIPMSCST